MNVGNSANRDDPLASLAPDEIYKLKISDSRIDLAARLFRECESMSAHIASRGIDVDEKLLGRLSLLSVGIKQRHSVPLSALMQLHNDLADVIEPAIPATTELMLWEARRFPHWSFLAPVTSIRYLMGFAFVSTILFCLILVFGGLTTAEISRSILSPEHVTVTENDNSSSQQDINADKPEPKVPDNGKTNGVPGLGADEQKESQAALKSVDTKKEEAAGVGSAEANKHTEAEETTDKEKVSVTDAQKLAERNTGNQGADPSSSSETSAQNAVLKRDDTEVDWQKRLMLTIFFLSISGIGASFAALYDARKFVVAGQFDPQAANYAIRILLGLIAGLLLSQVISQPYSATVLQNGVAEKDAIALQSGNMLTSLSKSILALLGGFAAQFVYKALKRLVDALEGVFDPDTALQSAVKNYQKQLAAQQKQVEDAERRNAELTQLGGQIANAQSEEERSQLQGSMVNVLVGSDTGEATSNANKLEQKKAEKKLDELEETLRAKESLALLLPEEEAKDAEANIAEWREKLRDLRKKGADLATVENIATVASLAAVVVAFNPVGMVLVSASKVLTGVLGNPAARRIPNLLRIMIAAGRSLDIDEYGKWKNVILAERNASADMSITEAIISGARRVLGRIPVIGNILRLFKKPEQDNEDEIIRQLIADVLKLDRSDAIARIKEAVAANDADAGELVDFLSSYLASENELGEAVKERLFAEIRDMVDTPVDELIDLARRAIGTGVDGQSVVERLLSIADAVADDAIPLTAEDVEEALRTAIAS